MHSKYGNQFRIDHVLGNKAMDLMTENNFYSHDERGEKVTDLYALLLELKLPNK